MSFWVVRWFFIPQTQLVHIMAGGSAQTIDTPGLFVFALAQSCGLWCRTCLAKVANPPGKLTQLLNMAIYA